MEMAPISSAPRSVEDIFKDYSGRRTGIIRALTHDVDEFYPLCDPEKENLCLYGHPNESWEVTLPAEEVPPELPEPALGINFARDGMVRRDWLSLVAMHSDSWLLSVAFYLAAPFNRSERKRLFSMINDLPAVFEVVTERKPAKEKPSADSGSKSRLNNTKRSNDGLVKNIKLADEAYVEDEDEHSKTLCGTEPSPERDATTPRSDRDYLMMVELMKKMDMVIKQNAELTRRMKNIEDRQKHLKNTNVELNAALIRIQMKLDITPPGSEEDEEDRADSDSDSSSDTPLPENAPARNVRAPTVQKKKASTKQQQQAQQNGTTGEGNTSSGVHEEPVAPTLEATLPTPEIVLRGDVTMDNIRTPHLVEVQPEQQEEETASEIEDNNESQEEIPPTAQSKPGEGDASPPVSDHDIGPILRSLPISVHPPMVSETPPEPSDATPIPDDAAKKEKRSKKNADREATQAQEATIEERPKIRAVHPKSRLILPPSDSSSSSSEEDQGKTPPYSASNKERARIAQEEEEKEADSDYVPSG